MKYCSKCGKEIMDEAIICPNCGCAVNAGNVSVNPVNPDDAPSTGMAVLGFFIPLVGLIIYLVTKDKTPLKAKSAGKGALIGFVVAIVGAILSSVLFAGVLGSILR